MRRSLVGHFKNQEYAEINYNIPGIRSRTGLKKVVVEGKGLKLCEYFWSNVTPDAQG